MLIGCADRDENVSHLKKIGPNPPQSNTKPIRIEGRQPSDGRQVWKNQLCACVASLRWLGFAFGGNVTLSTSKHRHYDESVHRIKQLTRGNHTICFSDILSLIRKLEARYVLFIADRSCRKIGVSASQLHNFMLLCTCSTPGKSVQAPIRL